MGEQLREAAHALMDKWFGVPRPPWHDENVDELVAVFGPILAARDEQIERLTAELRAAEIRWQDKDRERTAEREARLAAEAQIEQVKALLARVIAEKRIRHDHAYPMEIGPHHCDGCDLQDDIDAALCPSESKGDSE